MTPGSENVPFSLLSDKVQERGPTPIQSVDVFSLVVLPKSLSLFSCPLTQASSWPGCLPHARSRASDLVQGEKRALFVVAGAAAILTTSLWLAWPTRYYVFDLWLQTNVMRIVNYEWLLRMYNWIVSTNTLFICMHSKPAELNRICQVFHFVNVNLFIIEDVVDNLN